MDFEEDPKIQKIKMSETERILDKLVGGLMPTKERRVFFSRMTNGGVKASKMNKLRLDVLKIIKTEVKMGKLEPTEENINKRIGEIIQENSSPVKTQQKIKKSNNKETALENKFGVRFKGKKWFQCQIEEVKYSTFTNQPVRNVDTAYVIINDDNFEIIKESVWIKTNMGTRKMYFANITSIDYDARGRLHASSSVIINTKSAEHIQLKFVSENVFIVMNQAFESYLKKANTPQQPIQQTITKDSDADELLKYGELLEKGLITQEEFNLKKAEIFGSVSKPIKEPVIETVEESEVIQENEYQFCPECGTKIENDAKFCTNCGFQLKH